MAPTDVRLERDEFELVFTDGFDRGQLDLTRWFPWYLPQWSDRERTSTRYRFDDGRLVLRIDADTPEWSPEFDPGVRVANLQTGVGSGPVGSTLGQHHFRPGLVVREAQPPKYLYAPDSGLVEVRLAATEDPRCLTALWLIGIEDEPHRSGELCVVEIFGRDVRSDGALVGMGIHPFGDPFLVEDFHRVPVTLDVRKPHDYAVAWRAGRADFFIDEVHVLRLEQAPDYPMQLMLNLYELPTPNVGTPPGPYPKEAIVHRVRGYRHRGLDDLDAGSSA
jgi:hypothetical protein